MKLLLYLTFFVGVLAAQVPTPTVDEHAKEEIQLAAELKTPEPVTKPQAPTAVAQPVQSTAEELSRPTGELPLLGLIGLLAMTSVLFLGRFQS